MSMVGVITLLAALFAGGLKYPSTRLKRGYLWRSFGITSLIIIILVALIALLGFVVASSDEGLPTVLTLADDLDQTLAVRPQDPSLPERLQWSLSTVSTLLPEVLVNRAPYSALVILLAGLMFITIYLGLRLLDRDYDRALENLIEDPPQNESFVTDSATETAGASKVEYLSLSETSSHESEVRPPQITMPNALPFVLLLILTGVLLTLGPEFVYLKDNFGQRINTIFKFYYQAWVLFGVSALFGIDYLLRRFKAVGIAAATVYGLLLVASLLFPYYAIQSRSLEYRGPAVAENQYPATLNGLDYLRKYNVDELEAIEWLRENIVGTPVILEAVGGQYTGFGRVSASTGLPTVLGWAGHEYQWRGSTPEPAQRGSVVELIYDGRDWAQLTTYLNAYDVEYIYMGANERNLYGNRAEELFDQYLDLAYQNNSVKIYRWLPSAQG
jgi:hypothetical protein